MTTAQLTYPLITCVEVILLIRLRVAPPQVQNAAALRLWLRIQVALFCVLEPASFLKAPYFAELYILVTVVSCAADLMVLYSVFYCLEDGFPAFGSIRAWATVAILTGLLFCLGAGLALPRGARGIDAAWLTLDQGFTYIRILCLIALSFYGWLRASSWPRELAWTWLAMALYSFTDALIVRLQILWNNSQAFELVMTTAAILQIAGLWRALSYSPKPLTSIEIEAVNRLQITDV